MSGSKADIEALRDTLEKSGIQADLLPTAIPYHTSLVAGVIDTDRQELLDLKMTAPQIRLGLAQQHLFILMEKKELKEITTELFSKPILFRQSIEALYKEGVRKFVEVGPKGTLTPVVSEILTARPHIAVTSNRSSFSAIAQLNHMMAALFSSGVSMNLDYLYARREPKAIDFHTEEEKKKPTTNALLNLSYPAVKLLDGWQERTGLSNQYLPASDLNFEPLENELTEDEPKQNGDNVISSYLETIPASIKLDEYARRDHVFLFFF